MLPTRVQQRGLLLVAGLLALLAFARLCGS